jgi:hypothetical protein
MWAKNAGKLYMAKYSLAKEELPQPKDGFFSPSPAGGFSDPTIVSSSWFA